jgi:hypothetical protein
LGLPACAVCAARHATAITLTKFFIFPLQILRPQRDTAWAARWRRKSAQQRGVAGWTGAGDQAAPETDASMNAKSWILPLLTASLAFAAPARADQGDLSPGAAVAASATATLVQAGVGAAMMASSDEKVRGYGFAFLATSFVLVPSLGRYLAGDHEGARKKIVTRGVLLGVATITAGMSAVAALGVGLSGHPDAAKGLLYTTIGVGGLGVAGSAVLGIYDIATTPGDVAAAPRLQVGVLGADLSGHRAAGAALALRF